MSCDVVEMGYYRIVLLTYNKTYIINNATMQYVDWKTTTLFVFLSPGCLCQVGRSLSRRLKCKPLTFSVQTVTQPGCVYMSTFYSVNGS